MPTTGNTLRVMVWVFFERPLLPELLECSAGTASRKESWDVS